MDDICFILDLDGTIVDSKKMTYDALIETLSENHPYFNYADLNFGESIQELMVKIGIKPENKDWFIRTFRIILKKKIENGTKFFPGAKEILCEFIQKEIPFAMATNKPFSLAWPIVAQLELNIEPRLVVCVDGFNPKPEPDIILEALNRLGASRGFMIGDSPVDIRAAKAAGLFSIGIQNNNENTEVLTMSEPDFVFKDFIEIRNNLNFLLTSFIKQK